MKIFTTQIICVLIFLFCFQHLSVQCQQTNQKEWSLVVHGAVQRTYITDPAYSATPFSGTGWSSGVGLQYLAGRSLHRVEANYSSANLYLPETRREELQPSLLQLGYNYLHQIGNGKRLVCRAGANLGFIYNDRVYKGFINNNGTYDFAASLGAAVQLDYSLFPLTDDFLISNRLELPLISMVQYPDFGSEGTTGRNTNRIGSIPEFLRINNQLSAEKRWTPGFSTSLFYNWDFYRFPLPRSVKQAGHRVGIAAHIIL
jgi:hypothetical protein